MEKFIRDITFEGINNEIKETLNELGYTNIEYLEDFCNENNFELIIKTQSYKSHEENRWISIDEKLPNYDKRTQNLSEDVQVTVKNEFGTIVDVAYYDYAEKEWHIELFDNGEVLAWKPLPQPYESCLIGEDDAETSENICNTLLFLYNCGYTNDNYLFYDVYIDNGNERTFVKTLEIKDYTSLVIVNEHGIEIDPYGNEFIDAIVKKVDESLNNGNLQTTMLYKSIFKTQEDIDNDEKYNYLIDKVTKSVKKYMLADTERRFDVDVSEHYISCYLFYEVPTIRDYYIDDITDVLSYEDI